MAVVISGNGIDMGNNPVSNASQVDGVVINENGDNVATISNLVGFKNYIINGNFDIWQRGTSQTTSDYGSDDRWLNSHNGSTKTHSRVDCTDTERALFNASYFSRTVVSSVAGSVNYCFKDQRIEDVTRLAGKTVTLSFWAKADSNRNIAIEFHQYFGDEGSPSTTVNSIGVTTVPLTPTWQKKTVTVTLPSIIGKTLGTGGVHTSFTICRFWFEAGSNLNSRTNNLGQQSGTFDIAQVQLEEGSVATPFENRPYGLELSLCQRYYEANIKCGYVGSPFTTGVSYGGTFTMTAKRVLPTFTLAGDTNHSSFPNGIPSIGERTLNGFRAYKNATAAGGQAYWSSLLNVSAEL